RAGTSRRRPIVPGGGADPRGPRRAVGASALPQPRQDRGVAAGRHRGHRDDRSGHPPHPGEPEGPDHQARPARPPPPRPARTVDGSTAARRPAGTGAAIRTTAGRLIELHDAAARPPPPAQPPDRRDSMSGHGSPEQQIPPRPDTRIAIVAGSWHQQVMDGLLDGALRACREGGITDPTIVRVPGSFELPVVAAHLAPTHDAVVAL